MEINGLFEVGKEAFHMARMGLLEKFLEVQSTYSAVLRNTHGDDTSFEAS